MPKSPEERRAAEVERAERLQRILTYRKAGLTITEIAAQLGVHKSTVSRQYQSALKSLYTEDLEEHRALELARIEAMFRKVYPMAMQGHLGAVDRAVKLSESKRKLLGLDQPARVDIGMPDVDLESATAEVLAAAAAQAMSKGAAGGTTGD